MTLYTEEAGVSPVGSSNSPERIRGSCSDVVSRDVEIRRVSAATSTRHMDVHAEEQAAGVTEERVKSTGLLLSRTRLGANSGLFSQYGVHRGL